VQYRESDWDFISRLMEEEGIYHFWRERNGTSIMHLTDGPNGHFDVAFGPEVRFHSPDGLAPDPRTIHDLRVRRQIRPGVVSLQDYAARKPGIPLNVTVVEDAGAAEVFDYPGEYRDAGLGRRLAQVRLEELRTGFHGMPAVRLAWISCPVIGLRSATTSCPASIGRCCSRGCATA